LQHVIKGRPLKEDNEKAAIALIAFKDEDGVAELCFDLLQQEDVQKDLCLPTYLVLACAGLKDSTKRAAFVEMSKNDQLPPLLREDMKTVIGDWEQERKNI
jgi:hypothetical protein